MPEQESAPQNGAGEAAAASPDSAAPAGKQTAQTVSPVLEGVDALRADLAARRAAGLKVLTGPDIIAAQDVRYQVVQVPEWGGEVIVRALTGTERDAFEASVVQRKGKENVVTTLNIRAKLCALSIVDPADPNLTNRAFGDAQVAALGMKSAGALSRVYDVSAELSGISEKDTEELAKNSERAVSDDSSLRSQ